MVFKLGFWISKIQLLPRQIVEEMDFWISDYKLEFEEDAFRNCELDLK
jgi:hypothetical protein